ncbi:5'-3'-deoxyribonucleotidase [Paenibacillus sp. J5C_2022]|uniref:5' nucleotidase, NT5C type n=1 Tax=Paenibacillus sp. J5C2022 TaxID=2977129 RepID=UPI0021D2B652|nr:5'-3'-deoxyribonucleotidase [Paenibacillus sp. J5C2022]MCU6708246.1 5'-3'-deoxyribonucleotidase [Paenibacillus sp. J5C2022]
MKRIAIDMDEVIADTAVDHLEQFNDRYNDNVTLEELEGTTLVKIRPHRKAEIESYFASETFFRNLKVIEHSQDVIRELQERYEIYIATAAMEVPASFMAKYEWLQENFPFISDQQFVFCGDKSVIHADYLIDDNVKQLRKFTGQGILYTAAHNKYESGFHRVHDWHEVRELFLGASQVARI